MSETERKTLEAMLELYAGDAKRIQHFIKVNAFAQIIARREGVDELTRERISLAAYVHDIGIHESERKYNSSAGKYQEIEGPPLAEKLLIECGADSAQVQRICRIVATHHTYTAIDGIDLQILVEADFIVNCFEDGLSARSAENALKNIFRTDGGKKLLRQNFLDGQV